MAIDIEPTSLSAGCAVLALLEGGATGRLASAVYPVVEPAPSSAEGESPLPYVAYRRLSLQPDPVKDGRSADTAQIAVACYAATYVESVALAEAVRSDLDGLRGAEAAGFRVRRCLLADASESWEGDAYAQTLIFSIKI